MAQSVNIELVENLKPFIARTVQDQIAIISEDHPAVTINDVGSDPSNAIQIDVLSQVITFVRPSTADGNAETHKLLQPDVSGLVSTRYLGLRTSAVLNVELSIGASGTIDFANAGKVQTTLGVLEIVSLEEQSVGPGIPGIYLKTEGQDRVGIESTGISFNYLSGLSPTVSIEATGDISFVAGAFSGTGTAINLNSIVKIGLNSPLITTYYATGVDLTIGSGQDLILSPDRDVLITAANAVSISATVGGITLSPQGDLNLSPVVGFVKVPVLTVASRIDFTDAYPKITATSRLLMDITRLEFQEDTEIWVDDGALTLNPNYALILQGSEILVENDIEFAGGVARSIIFDISGAINTLAGDLIISTVGGDLTAAAGTGGLAIISSPVNVRLYGSDVQIQNDLLFTLNTAHSILFNQAGTIATQNGGLLTLASASGAIQLNDDINLAGGTVQTIAFAGDGVITTGTGNLTIDGITWPPSGSSHDPVTAGAYISLVGQEVSVIATINSESEPSKVVAADASGLTRVSGIGVGAAAVVNRVMIGGSPGFIGFSNAGMISNVSGNITIQPASHVILKPTSDIVYIEGNLEFDGSVARSIIFDAQGTISTLAGNLVLTPFSGTLQINANINFPAAKSITTTAGDITFAPTNNVAFHPVNEQIYFKGQVKFESATKIETLVGNMELAAAGNLIINPFVAFLIKEKSTPATPPAGYAALWFDTAGDLYYKNDAGTARKVSYT